MPIHDYKQRAIDSKKALFNKTEISEANKKYLISFFLSYESRVKPARLVIFNTHIAHLLTKTKDIKKDMNNRDLINSIFLEYKDKYSLSQYATLINVSKTFVRWLNDNETPKGFKDIKSVKKKELKRDLNKDDMISWEEGLKLVESAPSIQWKAIVLTQLDAGFRPSEFVDLNFGDMTYRPPYIIAKVIDGKTGSREVVLYRSVPYLKLWLDAHPTKKATDPLWCMEYYANSSKTSIKGQVIRYGYDAIRKRIRDLGKRAKINKPFDFYNLRHSACRLAKLENLPLELASKKFGHSTQFFTNTYGRLDTEDEISRYNQFKGIKTEETKNINENTILCQTCKHTNTPDKEMCFQCGNPLTEKKAFEIKAESEQDLKTRVLRIQEEELKRLQKTHKKQMKKFIDDLSKKKEEDLESMFKDILRNKAKKQKEDDF